MADNENQLSGPNLGADGVPPGDVPDGGILLGHAGGHSVMLVRRGGEVFALGATCTHYGGPLAEGVFDGESVRCPWHHACFDVRTGEAGARARAQPGRSVRGRAARWPPVRRRQGRARAGAARRRRSRRRRSSSSAAVRPATRPPRRCAREGYDGPITHGRRRRDASPTTGPTSRRTTSPAPPRRTGCPLRDGGFYAEQAHRPRARQRA